MAIIIARLSSAARITKRIQGFGLLVNVSISSSRFSPESIDSYVAFFQGLYIDHNLENGTVGFATLKGANPGSTTTPTPTASTPTPTGGAIVNRQSAWAMLVLVFTLVVVTM